MSVRRIAGRAASFTLFAAAPLLLTAFVAKVAVTGGPHGSDFWTFWAGGRAVLHGHSPYPALASLPAVADKHFAPFVYPPVAAVSMIPLSLLPFTVAAVVFLLINLAAVGLALRLFGVSDWRCYGVAYASVPVFAGSGLGAVGQLLFLGVALAWRYRDRAVAVGLLVAWVMTAKLFLWPLWLWLVRTRRYVAAAVAAGAAVAGLVVSWSIIGFAGMRDYPRLLARMTELEGPHSYSLYSLMRSFGVGGGSAERVVYVASLLAVAAALVLLRGDRAWLVGAIGIALLATPILWPHYLVLLFAPIALAERRFSPLWFAPLLLWLDGAGWSGGTPWRIVGVLVFTAAVVHAGLGGRRPGGLPWIAAKETQPSTAL